MNKFYFIAFLRNILYLCSWTVHGANTFYEIVRLASTKRKMKKNLGIKKFNIRLQIFQFCNSYYFYFDAVRSFEALTILFNASFCITLNVKLFFFQFYIIPSECFRTFCIIMHNNRSFSSRRFLLRERKKGKMINCNGIDFDGFYYLVLSFYPLIYAEAFYTAICSIVICIGILCKWKPKWTDITKSFRCSSSRQLCSYVENIKSNCVLCN